MPEINPLPCAANSSRILTKNQRAVSGPSDICLNPNGSMSKGQNPDRVAAACQDFESVLVTYMLKTMRQSVPKEGWLDSGEDSDFYQGLMDWEVAVQASRQNRFGLWKALYHQVTGKDPGSLPTNTGNQSLDLLRIENPTGGTCGIFGDGITNHLVGGVGSSRAAEPTPENPGDFDTP